MTTVRIKVLNHPRAGHGPYRYRHHHGAFPPKDNMQMYSRHHNGTDEHHEYDNEHDHNSEYEADHGDDSNAPKSNNSSILPPILTTGVFEMSGIDISDTEKSFPAYYECELRPNGLLYGVRDKKLQCFGRWKEVDDGKGLITFTLEWDGDHYQYQGKYNKDLKQFGGQWTVLDSQKKNSKGENGSFLYSVNYKNPLPESEAQQIKNALAECQKLLKNAMKNVPGFKAKITMDIESKL